MPHKRSEQAIAHRIARGQARRLGQSDPEPPALKRPAGAVCTARLAPVGVGSSAPPVAKRERSVTPPWRREPSSKRKKQIHELDPHLLAPFAKREPSPAGSVGTPASSSAGLYSSDQERAALLEIGRQVVLRTTGYALPTVEAQECKTETKVEVKEEVVTDLEASDSDDERRSSKKSASPAAARVRSSSTRAIRTAASSASAAAGTAAATDAEPAARGTNKSRRRRSRGQVDQGSNADDDSNEGPIRPI